MIGPRFVFFTGGTALKDISQEMARQDIYSVHLVTTFDSGGSSAHLRKAFGIPAVGDLRNRLLALADRSQVSEHVIDFCKHRLSTDRNKAFAELINLAAKQSAHWLNISEQFRFILQHSLQYFMDVMPATFNPSGACIGNLILASSYLENKRNFEPAIGLMSSIFKIKGYVLPIINASLQLCAKLSDGSYLIGQHLFKKAPLRINEIFLTVHDSELPFSHTQNYEQEICHPELSTLCSEELLKANVICYPIGSFYSSVLANLLPKRCGQVVAKSKAKKVFIPNSGNDPELHGETLSDQVKILLDYLHKDVPQAKNNDLLHYILVDKINGHYNESITESLERELNDIGVRIIDRRVVKKYFPGQHDADSLIKALEEISQFSQ